MWPWRRRSADSGEARRAQGANEEEAAGEGRESARDTAAPPRADAETAAAAAHSPWASPARRRVNPLSPDAVQGRIYFDAPVYDRGARAHDEGWRELQFSQARGDGRESAALEAPGGAAAAAATAASSRSRSSEERHSRRFGGESVSPQTDAELSSSFERERESTAHSASLPGSDTDAAVSTMLSQSVGSGDSRSAHWQHGGATSGAVPCPASQNSSASNSRASPALPEGASAAPATEEEILAQIQELQFRLLNLRDHGGGGGGGGGMGGFGGGGGAGSGSASVTLPAAGSTLSLASSGGGGGSYNSLQWPVSAQAQTAPFGAAAGADAPVAHEEDGDGEPAPPSRGPSDHGGHRDERKEVAGGGDGDGGDVHADASAPPPPLSSPSSSSASSAAAAAKASARPSAAREGRRREHVPAVSSGDGVAADSLHSPSLSSSPRQRRESAPSEGAAARGDGYNPKLIVVSNRLPITIKRGEAGGYEYTMSAGGMVSALEGVLEQKAMPSVWVGWPGGNVAMSEQEAVRRQLYEEHSLVPVYLNPELHDLYYNGFCNDVLWPLFHYVPLPVVAQDGERKFDFKFWTAYTTANHRFAEAVLSVYRPGDVIWVQDYHLMLLPSLLRRRLRDAALIGFFLHTPFPSSEVYRILPVRKEVLQGVLAADLIGFHTYDYARHFLSVCTRILGLESSPRGVGFYGHFARVGIFPIGIDPLNFVRTLEMPAVQERIGELRERFRNKRILIGVDRLDYIKGVPHKLLALETLLKRHPEWKGKVVLIQIAVPSRTEVEEYRKLISHTNELVGRINGRFGSVDYAPIMFINQSIAFEELCALYTVADVALITSIRDGMNLVSYEYVMCQRENHGVLVLSEFAGSAQSLSGTLRVNPWNVEELGAAMHEALAMTPREREVKHWKLYRYVTTHTAAYWADSYLTELKQAEAMKRGNSGHHPQLPQADLLHSVKSASARVFLFSYEGAVVQPHSIPELATPPHSLMRALHRLASDPRNMVFVMSGRDRARLETWFGVSGGGAGGSGAGSGGVEGGRRIALGLIAEDGQFYRLPSGKAAWRATRASSSAGGVHNDDSDDNGGAAADLSWKHELLPLLSYYTARTPGSFLEQKERMLSWHYRDADPDYGVWQAHELQAHLTESCATLPVEIVHVSEGVKCIEVRRAGVSRASAVREALDELRSRSRIDVCVCVGSGGNRDDEQLYDMLRAPQHQPPPPAEQQPPPPPQRAIGAVWTCCVVGSDASRRLHSASDWTTAEYHLADVEQGRALVRELAALVPGGSSRTRQRHALKASASATSAAAAAAGDHQHHYNNDDNSGGGGGSKPFRGAASAFRGAVFAGQSPET